MEDQAVRDGAHPRPAGVERLVGVQEEVGPARLGLDAEDADLEVRPPLVAGVEHRAGPHARDLAHDPRQAVDPGLDQRRRRRVPLRGVAQRLVEGQRVAERDAVDLADQVVEVGGDVEDVGRRRRVRGVRSVSPEVSAGAGSAAPGRISARTG